MTRVVYGQHIDSAFVVVRRADGIGLQEDGDVTSFTVAEVDAVADALRAEAETFEYPVDSYVSGEHARRWKLKNDGCDYWSKHSLEDSENESWRILARAALFGLAKARMRP